MNISREWATPIVIGAFFIMAVTGILMFFHAEIGLNKLAHEWLGWVFVIGALTHIIVNWNAFKRYFSSSNLARAIVGSFAIVLLGSFIQLSGDGGHESTPRLAIEAIINAPIAAVAPLTGRGADAVLKDLKEAGIDVQDAQSTLKSAAKGDRGKIGQAIGVLFEKQGADH